MSNLAKIVPEYDMYDAYSISSNDSEGNLHEPILRPSQIISIHSESKHEYDSDSSDEYDIIVGNVKKMPYVIQKSLESLRLRDNSMPSSLHNSLIGEKKKTNMKKIVACVTTFITGVTILFAFAF